MSKQAIETRDLDSLKNGALAAWIRTFPIEDRLQEYLQHLAPELRRDIEQSARDAFAAADSFLESSSKRGAIDLSEFYPALEAHLQTIFPWIEEVALAALKSYTGWYSWHEGYLAPEP